MFNLNYRITGQQSIERIEPLLLNIQIINYKLINFNLITSNSNSNSNSSSSSSNDNNENNNENNKLHFVWETFCEKEWREKHNNSNILNRLSNSQIFEDKGNYAFLQLRMNNNNQKNNLKSYIALNRNNLLKWCVKKWNNNESDNNNNNNNNNNDNDNNNSENNTNLLDITQLASQSFLGEPYEWSLTNESIHSSDWWAVKASRGNGGKDVWIIHKDNYQQVVPTLPELEEYVIQRYVANPLLWHSKKFHFRCYGVIFGDLSGYLYEKCYILCASNDYNNVELNINDKQHLTNLSINKKSPNHPGQVPCWLSNECPQLFEQISSLFAEIINSSAPFLSKQTSINHFEFVGLDILCDSFGNCYILEINRCPGLESSNNRNKLNEEVMYNEMMISLIEIVLQREKHLGNIIIDEENRNEENQQIISSNLHLNEIEVNISETSTNIPSSILPPFSTILSSLKYPCYWRCIHQELRKEQFNEDEKKRLYENLFSWKAFTKKSRSQIIVE